MHTPQRKMKPSAMNVWHQMEEPLREARNLTRALKMMFADLEGFDADEFTTRALYTVANRLLESLQELEELWKELPKELSEGPRRPKREFSMPLTVVKGGKSN
jgi:hypothetical protein